MKKCSIQGCPGEYEQKIITHMVRHQGVAIVIEGVPADVCSVCGDILLSLKTAVAIETMLKNPGIPTNIAPVYKMPEAVAA